MKRALFLIAIMTTCFSARGESPVIAERLPGEADALGFLEKQPALALKQHWLAAPEESFAPAAVQVAWDAEYLYVFAKLTDRDIFNPVRQFNEPAFEHGDIFEILVRPLHGSAYFEFHITPHGQILQLRFADEETIRSFQASGKPVSALIEAQRLADRVLSAQTAINLEKEEWTVLAKISAAALTPEGRLLTKGDAFLFSFCRYDRTRGRDDAVLSSTSAYTVRSFHRQDEWRRMVLE